MFLASLHAIIPGLYRVGHDIDFFGNSPEEKTIIVLHMASSFFGITFILLLIRLLTFLYRKEARALQKLSAFAVPQEAKSIGLPGFLDLRGEDNLKAWLLLRNNLLAADEMREASILHSALIPIVLVDIALALAIVIRVVFSGTATFDIFLILGVFDIGVVSSYLTVMIRYLAACNETALRVHLDVLEQGRYETVQQMIDARSTDREHQVQISVMLFDSAISNLKNLADPVKFLGFVVDEALILQFVSLLGAAFAAGAAKILGLN